MKNHRKKQRRKGKERRSWAGAQGGRRTSNERRRTTGTATGGSPDEVGKEKTMTPGIIAYKKEMQEARRKAIASEKYLTSEYRRKYYEQNQMYQQVVDRITEFSKYSALLPPKGLKIDGDKPYREWAVEEKIMPFLSSDKTISIRTHVLLLDWIEWFSHTDEATQTIHFTAHMRHDKVAYQFSSKQALLAQSMEDLVERGVWSILKLMREEASHDIKRDHPHHTGD